MTCRCDFPECRKKLKLSDMECRCGKRFCLKHRLPEDHVCSIDYKNVNPIHLEKCVAEKIIKI
jgi:predicted nucleic acid binding AN1-type Zn finger protein